jgi:hypothetical protein
MKSAYSSISLAELTEKRNAKLRSLQLTGLTEAEAEAILDRQGQEVRHYMDTHYSLFDPEDISLLKSEAKLVIGSGFAVCTAALSTAMLMNPRPLTLVPVWVRVPVRIATLFVPAIMFREYTKTRAAKLRMHIEEKYGDRIAPLLKGESIGT